MVLSDLAAILVSHFDFFIHANAPTTLRMAYLETLAPKTYG